MSANSIANDITNRMERWTGQANGQKRQESRSIVGASIVRNYFQDDVDPNGALTQVNSLSLGVIPNLPPGTLPPVVLPFDPTATTPVCVVAVDSEDPKNDESVLYDVGRYEVRNYIMGIPGAVAPVVFGGKIRTVLAYLDREKMQARNMSPIDVMKALDASNVFFPSADAKFGTTDYIIDSNSMFQTLKDMADIPLRYESGRTLYLGDVATPTDASYIQTNVVRVNGKREVYIPVFRQLGASTLSVVSTLGGKLKEFSRAADALRDQPQAGDGPVGLREELDHGAGAGGRAGRDPLLAGDPDVPGRDPDDGDRHHDAADLDHGLVGGPVLHRADDQRHDAGRDDAGDRADDRQRHHLPGEHPPAPGPGRDAARGGLPGGQRGRHARAGLDHLHVPGARAAGPDARPGAVPLQADGHGRGVLDDRRLYPVADPGAGVLGLLAQGARRPRSWRRPWWRRRARRPRRAGPAHAEPETFTINGNGHGEARRGGLFGPIKRAFAPLGADDRDRHRLLRPGPRRRAPAPRPGDRRRLRHVRGDGRPDVADPVPSVRRDFFPEVDAGAFEMYVRRTRAALRIEVTEQRIKEVEDFVKETIDEEDLQLVLSEIGVTADWSAAYTPNAGPMDAVVKIQLTAERHHSAQEYVHILRTALNSNPKFSRTWSSPSTPAAWSARP